MKPTWFISIAFALICLFAACDNSVPSLQLQPERCADMPIPLTAAAHCVMDGKAYIFGGRTSNNQFNTHIYSYDPLLDQWTDLGESPLKPRVRPRAISVGNKMYVGLGANGKVLIDSTYLTDWWQWNPHTNQWKNMAQYPSDRTVGPVVVSDEQYIYMAYGGRRNFERWIFRYNTANDEWIQLADGTPRMANFPPRAHSAAGAICQGRYFLGSGFFVDSQRFWVEAEIAQDSVIWHKRAPLPSPRHNALAISDDSFIYLAGGNHFGGTLTTGHIYDDILRYDTNNDTWSTLCQLPDGGRENMVGWIIQNTLYIGLGSDKYDNPCQQLYRIPL